jgi:hypothetical protein
MGYYGAGDFYGQGDSAIMPYRPSGGLLGKAVRTFMPGLGPNVAIAKGVVRGGLAAAKKALGGGGRVRRAHGRRPRVMGARRYKRMNPLNPRALRRALRRAKGFERFARGVLSITRPHAGRRFKFPGRKRHRR